MESGINELIKEYKLMPIDFTHFFEKKKSKYIFEM